MIPEPVEKNGPCPPGYRKSLDSKFCEPDPSISVVHPALPKIGACPTDWNEKGNYCVAESDDPTNVKVKEQDKPCGADFTQQGNYCVQKVV